MGRRRQISKKGRYKQKAFKGRHRTANNSRALGFMREHYALECLLNQTLIKPAWFESARKADRGADLREGTDIVVRTKSGRDLPVQIKSSESGRFHFLKKCQYRGVKITCVVVRHSMSAQIVLEAIFKSLESEFPSSTFEFKRRKGYES